MFCLTRAEMRLLRMPIGTGFVPAEQLIVVFCVAVADCGTVMRAPNMGLDSRDLPLRLVGQARESRKHMPFHECSQQVKAGRMGLTPRTNTKGRLI